jgi:hypothetical protein
MNNARLSRDSVLMLEKAKKYIQNKWHKINNFVMVLKLK